LFEKLRKDDWEDRVGYKSKIETGIFESCKSYADGVAVLATMHGTEKAIAPAFSELLGLSLTVTTNLNTDNLGTFSGEISRYGTTEETAIARARPGRKEPIVFSPHLYKARNVVERFFNKLTYFRRIATRYGRTMLSYLGFVHIVAIRLWTRQFVNRT